MKKNESLSEEALEKVNAGNIDLLNPLTIQQSIMDTPTSSSSAIPEIPLPHSPSSMGTTEIPSLGVNVLDMIQQTASNQISETPPLLKSQSDLLTKPGAVSQTQSDPLKKIIP